MVDESRLSEMLRLAVEKAGGQTAFARMVGCHQSNVSLLLKRNRPLPARFVLAAEAGTGIPRHSLRPDIYPCEPAPTPAPTPTELISGEGQ